MALTLTLSFLPPASKAMLQTRGPLHFWAHLYLFAMMCGISGAGYGRRLPLWQVSAVALVLAGVIEVFQARGVFQAVEWPDLLTDVTGVLCGVWSSWLRTYTGAMVGGTEARGANDSQLGPRRYSMVAEGYW